MASGTKEYKIVINGLTESIEQVKVLTNMLDELDARIKSLEGRKVNISTPTMKAPTVDTGNNADLQEQSKLLQQIEATEQKIADARSKDYQELIRLKDELKQVKAEQDAAAASAKLMENSYAENTMAGLKEQLKDIKRVLNETEIGSDAFNELTKEANELNEKLKEIEKSYGQFGRNVGNYASAADGFKDLKIQVGDTVREFDNAREALRELKNERDTLALMGEDFRDLDIAVKQLQSSIKDMSMSSSFMDNMLDSMQSIVAIASTAEGIGAVFGKDNEKIEETIKKLVALQNVLQGLETIQKQMQTNEGLGKWLSAGNNAINKFTTGLLGTKKAVEGVTEAQKTATVASKAFGVALKGIGIGLIISLIVSLTSKWDKINASINKSFPALEKFGGILGAIEGAINGVINAMGNMFEILERLIHLDFSGAWGIVTQSFADGYREVADEQVRIKAAADAEELKLEMEKLEAMYGEEVKYTQRYRQLLARRNQLLKDSYNPNTDEGKKSLKELEIEQEREKKAYKDHVKEMTKLQRESDRELTNLRISNMKEGLNKTLTQLEEERKARIVKARETGRNVREIEAEINRQYDNEILRTRKEYAEKTVEIYRNMIDAIKELELQGMRNDLSMLETSNELDWNMADQLRYMTYMPKNAFNYGSAIGIISDKEIKDAQEYTRLIERLTYLYDYLDAIDKEKEPTTWDMLIKRIQDAEKELLKFTQMTEGYELPNGLVNFGFGPGSKAIQRLDLSKMVTPPSYDAYLAEQYEKDISEIYNTRMDALNKAYDDILKETDKNEGEIYDLQLKILRVSMDKEADELKKAHKNISDETNDWYDREMQMLEVSLKNGEITIDEYNAKRVEKTNEFNTEMGKLNGELAKQLNGIEERYKVQELQLDHEFYTKRHQRYEKYYQEALQEVRDYESAINTAISKAQGRVGSGDIKSIREYRKRLKEAKEETLTLIYGLTAQMNQLNSDFSAGLISPEVFQNTNRELRNSLETANDTLGTINNELKGTFARILEEYLQYYRAFAQTLSSVLDAVWAYQDAAYEKELEQMDKELEVMEEQLDKQKDLVQEYANSVDSIEDELATARGDRRQELIDQLNAERAAQRAALKEQERIEKEKEKLEEKAEKMEIEQRKRQQKRDITQAIINASLAISYAALNTYPLPALPMIAAATIQGAAQVAAIKAQKFATGGVIDGKSHSQGGVKVLGGTAEVEGGEFITNKYTTAKNVHLLEFINDRKKKINLEDLIDFYTDGRMKRNIISASPNRRYADGGTLPTLRSDIDLPSRIMDTLDAYANRPVVVSVSEILDVRDDINAVRVQSGLERR